MKQTVNRELIAEQMNALGLSERRVLNSVSLSQHAFREARLNGRLQGHITLRQASELAAVLGVDLADLLRTTEPDDFGSITPAASSDASVLIPVLLAVPRLVDLGHLSRSLEWDRGRLREAIDAIPVALESTGLRLVTSGTSVTIQPMRPADRWLGDRIGRIQSRTAGLNLAQAKLLRRLFLGDNITQRPTKVDKLAFGALKNMGCIELDHAGGWEITAQLTVALAIDE